ncbi:hypothetical protein, partial [Archangium violaceum]|uniref:hypothetical protein n=1 Tax=Archangium violaceum TaxID=83451 RepID=UPI0005BC7EB0
MSQPARQSVSTPSATNTAGTFGLLLATLGVLVVVGAQRLPAGTLDRALAQNLHLVRWAAVLVLVPGVLMGLGDFLRVRKRSYHPPSLRVQVARSSLYGCLLTAAQSLALFSLYPRPLADLAHLGWWALMPLAFAGAYAACFWPLLFRPRVFRVRELQPFATKAKALLFTNDFLIGKRGGEWNTLEGDPDWEIIPELAMFTNIYCLGGIGSGKT